MKSTRSILVGSVVVALAFAVAGPSGAQLAPEGDEFAVAESTNHRVSAPAAALSGGGEAFVLWERAYEGVEGASYTLDGAPATPARRLAESSFPDDLPFEGEVTRQADPAVAPLEEGVFLAVWAEQRQYLRAGIFHQDSELLDSRIVARRFSQAGAPAGRRVVLSGDVAGPAEAPQVMRLADGRLIVSWQVTSGGEPGGIYARRLGPGGFPLGPSFRVDESLGSPGIRPALAPSGAGFLAVWQGCCDAGGDTGVFGRYFDRRGTALGSAFSITGAGDQHWPAVAPGSSGEHLVAWMGAGAPDSELEHQVYGRALGPEGAFLGSEIALSSGEGRAHGAPTVAPADDGYVVAWTRWGPHFPVGIHAVATTAAGIPAGEPVRLNQEPIGFQWRLSLVPDGAGRHLAVWQGYGEDDRPAIKARVVSADSASGSRAAALAAVGD